MFCCSCFSEKNCSLKVVSYFSALIEIGHLGKSYLNPASKLFSDRGACVAQSVKCPTPVSAPVMISQFCEFEPSVGLRADSAKPAWDSLSLSACPARPLSK